MSGVTALGPARLTLLFFTMYNVLAIPALREWEIPAPVLAVSLPLALALAILSAIDLRSYRLPDDITLPLIFAGLAFGWIFDWPGMTGRVAGAAAGFVFLYGVAEAYRWLRGRDGLGQGDAKLLAAAGAWLGLDGLPTVLLWATGLALAAAGAAALKGYEIGGGTRIPFGPFLALGFWLVWLYGPLP